MKTIVSRVLSKKKKNSVTLDAELHWLMGFGVGLDSFKGGAYTSKTLIIILPFIVVQLIFKKSNK
tara:strand:+ start:2611 stop:2805 length:195 start_codon:yes stop_codon:yes gene_type:complete